MPDNGTGDETGASGHHSQWILSGQLACREERLRAGRAHCQAGRRANPGRLCGVSRRMIRPKNIGGGHLVFGTNIRSSRGVEVFFRALRPRRDAESAGVERDVSCGIRRSGLERRDWVERQSAHSGGAGALDG